MKHKAVPPEMTETAYRVAMSAFAFGPEKRHIFGRTECPCGSGDSETVEHTFWKPRAHLSVVWVTIRFLASDHTGLAVEVGT